MSDEVERSDVEALVSGLSEEEIRRLLIDMVVEASNDGDDWEEFLKPHGLDKGAVMGRGRVKEDRFRELYGEGSKRDGWALGETSEDTICVEAAEGGRFGSDGDAYSHVVREALLGDRVCMLAVALCGHPAGSEHGVWVPEQLRGKLVRRGAGRKSSSSSEEGDEG